MASIAEDPANRRVNGTGGFRRVLTLIPMFAPAVVMTANVPAVMHVDFSPVTSAQPAIPGEVLIVKATGLGPTRPGVDPGQPFPADAVQQVNSPVDVTVNGQAAEVINQIGWPGLLDTYRVDVRVPGTIHTGSAILQLSAAWIPAQPVNFPVQ